ncbi:PVC-type heme-binding CxxCH protein [Allorhodopirellula solitaria]|uniref:Cytochrome c n=1 Tax=Allorhodopirellula solitaria TaxID=2527987 RepID=A0A5C5YGV4_9BACT|nr:PVC-type heme-binding CxxCH protein [Allorhodopirellula solitaria]TWT74414.1 Cytochrome c [Allorhodopirellula solitaria]
MHCKLVLIVLAASWLAAPPLHAENDGRSKPSHSEVASPDMLVPGWIIESVASEPELVTPTGCCFDEAGRLLVIECHTHFPPDKYPGPTVDRVYRFDSTEEAPNAGRQRLFYEGGQATMAIADLGDGWIGLLSRDGLRRVRDNDDDGMADQVETVLQLKTKANYPHNGLSSLTVGPDGWLTIGQGENFGEPYELIGSDGSKQVGGGEGGNLFRCRPDGSQVQRIATGFWNPFGSCFDPAERLWVVGNDPDSMPPNRLLHIVPTADYGFQFRFGRAGTHPLQSWDGELPGTLPMAAAVGEAACDIVVRGKYLWVTSWGDNRIERYEMHPDGASLTGRTEVVVQGDAHFRPVGLALARDGSLYVTDWVDRSYQVHGNGRLWRLTPPADQDFAAGRSSSDAFPGLSEEEQRAAQLRTSDSISLQQRIEALGSDDAFLRQAAIAGLIDSDQLSEVELATKLSPTQATGVLAAWRWITLTAPNETAAAKQLHEWIAWGLDHPSDEVVIAAIRYATEASADEHLAAVERLLTRPALSPRVFAAVVSSIAYLETGSAAGSVRDPATEERLIKIISDSAQPATTRALALRWLSEQAEQITASQLAEWAGELNSREFSLEVTRLLAARQSEAASNVLAEIAANEALDDQTRADALAGLARNAGAHAAIINKLSLPRQSETLRTEANRILNRPTGEPIDRVPGKEDFQEWDALVGHGGDVDAGRRVFMRKTCIHCHAHNGRGARTGPDLSTLSGQITSRRVIESILTPSREIGPLYVPWRILTVDGQVLTGLKLHAPGVGNALRFQGADGNTFDVRLEDIEEQKPIDQSIMPAGLEQAMSVQEFQDLVAFLTEESR